MKGNTKWKMWAEKLCSPGQDTSEGSCNFGNEPTGSAEDGKFLYDASNWHFLKVMDVL
jgi:hypothetical protein